MTNRPDATMTIYDIPSIVRTALPLAATPSNITAGFQVSGIYSSKRDIFPDSEFMAAYVTDRPDPEQDLQDIEQNVNPGEVLGVKADLPELGQTTPIEEALNRVDNPLPDQETNSNEDLQQAGPSRIAESKTPTPQNSQCLQSSNKVATCSFTDLENLKPFPKAAERKVQLGRTKRKSEILTDTPIEDALEEERK
ncbi:uncharacterized protein [Leptinotarsa decemlineata]|uniref:uncharacterized protein n=1 Tax=Leptinotarsa decemlineata TaxID=7539 RepID=UPI003D30A6FB